jgi:hypothetical protein
MSTVLQFIRTGSLGLVSLGDSTDQVRAALGPPGDVSTSHHPLIWRFGALQVTFVRDRATLLGLYLDDGSEVGPVDLRSDPVVRAPYLDTVLSAAAAEGIALEPVQELTFPDSQYAFASDAGTTLVFDADRRLVKLLASAAGA